MEMTNKEFSKSVAVFQRACDLAKVEPTTRQASKYRMQKGSAFAFRQEAQEIQANLLHESISAMIAAKQASVQAAKKQEGLNA